MPCYKIKHTHSAMSPDYVGSSIKTAHTEDLAIICLAKGSNYDRKSKTVIDKQNNLLQILSIEGI